MKLYLDTNVYGYATDASKGDLQQVSLDILQSIRDGQYELVVSGVLSKEIESAPEDVQRLFIEMTAIAVEIVFNDARTDSLADAYISARAIGAGKRDDALHIALASLAQCDALLSWDTAHVVTDWRVQRYNSINRKHKLPQLTIQTPANFVQRRKRK